KPPRKRRRSSARPPALRARPRRRRAFSCQLAMLPIRLVAALGNPGRQYTATRHNAGFWFADALAAKLGVSMAHESRFGSEVGKKGDLRLAKPSTYMNDSGRAVSALAQFFAVSPAELLIVHDELDLWPVEAMLRLGGSVAGHNS